MLPQPLPYLFSLADEYSVTAGVFLGAIWLAALGCYIGEKLISSRSHAVHSEHLGTSLVEKAPARI